MIGLALTSAVLAGQARAGVVFTDNFDGENGGASAFNYTGFANFTVTGGGGVDIIADGSFFNCPGPGSCIDLDGTPGPARMTSVASFNFAAGDTVRLSFDLGGNQRGFADPGPDDFYAGFSFGATTSLLSYGFNYFGSDVVVGDYNVGGISTSSSLLADDPFARRSLFFTAGSAGTLQFFIGTDSGDNFGPILDNVELSTGGAVPEPAAWALLIAGFGLAGASLRGRRRLAGAA